jgi:hypothetical protein
LAKVFHEWQEGNRNGFAEGRSENWVHRDQDAREAASFLIAVYESYLMLAKNAQDVSVWKAGIRNIVGCLQSLRPSNKRARLS